MNCMPHLKTNTNPEFAKQAQVPFWPCNALQNALSAPKTITRDKKPHLRLLLAAAEHRGHDCFVRLAKALGLWPIPTGPGVACIVDLAGKNETA